MRFARGLFALLLWLGCVVAPPPAPAASTPGNALEQLKALRDEARAQAEAERTKSGVGEGLGARTPWAMALQELERIVQSLDPAYRAFRLGSFADPSRSLQTILLPAGQEAFRERIGRVQAALEQEQRVALEQAEKENAEELRVAREAALAAKGPKDLDAPIARLAALLARRKATEWEEGASTKSPAKVLRALSHWQDFLAYREAGDLNVGVPLSQLLQSDLDLVPRSDLLRHQTEINAKARAAALAAQRESELPAPTPPPNVSKRAGELLESIRALADLGRALPALQQLPTSNMPHPQQEIIRVLGRLQRHEAAFRAGALTAPPEESHLQDNSPYRALALRLQEELTLLVLPNFLRLTEPEFATRPGQDTLEGYLVRVLNRLRETDQWARALQTAELARSISVRAPLPVRVRSGTETALGFAVGGDSLRAAGQFRLAGLSYLQALRLAGPDLPMPLLQARLDRMRREQPEALLQAENDMARMLAPVPPAPASPAGK